MKAAVFFKHGGPEVLQTFELPAPEPGPGHVRLRVVASSLNHLDVWVRRGLPVSIALPHIGGSDIAGEVESVGPGVEGIEPGVRVVVNPSLGYEWYEATSAGVDLPSPRFGVIGEHGPGGLAEYAVVPASNLVQIPDEVDFEVAAAAGLVSVTAWRALVTRARVRAGESVLITGASGGVSTMALQIAKAAGARVYAVTSGPENVQRVRMLGADVVYDRLTADWGKEVWADSGKRGVDVVIDSVGAAIWGTCLRALAPSGRLVTYGATSGPMAESDLRVVFWKQLSIMGSTMGTQAEFRRVMELVFSGRIRPLIQQVLSLDDVRRGHELLESGQVFGKLVVKP